MFPNLSSPIFFDYNEYYTYDTNISNDKPGLQINVRKLKTIFLISQPNQVVGTQKNRLNEKVLLSTKNICLDCWVRK